ncbi:MAG: hypothetical protein ACFFD2_28745 [Promethearchaeota archaeon]
MEFTSLVLQFFFSVCAFYWALIFFLRIKRAKGAGIELSPFLGLGIFSLFVGVMYIFFGYENYFFFEYDLVSFFLYKSGVLSGYIGLIGLVFFSEKMFQKTKFGFTIFSVICCIYGISFLNTYEASRSFSYITMPISVIIVYINFLYFVIFRTKGEIRRKMGLVFICFFGFFFFYLLYTELGKILFPNLGELIVIIAMVGLIIISILWGILFLSFQTFTEFGWKEKMRELFIIAPNGVTLLHHTFIQRSSLQNADLVAAGLTGIRDLLAEMMQSEQKLKTVDHQDVKILFEYGKYSTIALVVHENLHIYKSKLTLLSTQFERMFQEVLPHWTGDVEVFLPAKQLIGDIFS